MSIEIKGIWFFGLSGSGKTFASQILNNKLKNSFIIDGDEVRKNISFDLGYSLIDREKQLERLLGLNRIVIRNNLIPITSSVLMTERIFQKCKKENIKVVKIVRSFDQIKKVRKIYESDIEVVGKDIEENVIKSEEIINDGNFHFERSINNYGF